MCQDLGLEAEIADGLAIIVGLLRGSGGGQFDVVDAKSIERLGTMEIGAWSVMNANEFMTGEVSSHLNLLFGGKVGIGKLFALYPRS